jgi:BirA family biotin operon repressor/biotin-[acetyl-CoA-carboxylase] ligase
LQISYLECVDSTQLYLKRALQKKILAPPFAVIAKKQINGIGSRDNRWEGGDGNLYLSFALSLEELPRDLSLASASIYFAYLLKEVLADNGSDIWLKWPNDFYLKEKKLGGMITTVVDQTLICGVGINLKSAPKNFSKLDIDISQEKLLNSFFDNVKKKILWKQVFSKYKLEFHKNMSFFTHKNNEKISLKNVSLQDDGSILSNGERIYSLR